MTTLYIRDVPTPVAQTLKERAAAEGQSLSAYVGARLSEIATRPTNADIVERLRTRERPSSVTPSRILTELHASRP